MKQMSLPLLKLLSYLFFLLIIFWVILLMDGCKKLSLKEPTSPKGDTSSLLAAAKSHFNDLVNVEQKISRQGHTVNVTRLRVSQRITPLLKMRPYILWENSNEYKYNDIDVLAIPLKENIQPFKNKAYEFFREIFFRLPGQKFE